VFGRTVSDLLVHRQLTDPVFVDDLVDVFIAHLVTPSPVSGFG
jgi:hypothetical protein